MFYIKKLRKVAILLFLSLILFVQITLAQNPIIKQFDKAFGGQSYEVFISIEQTFDKGYILSGHTTSGSSGDVTQPNWGYTDYWIIKIDSLANKQWDKIYGGTYFDWIPKVIQTAEGGYLLGGSSESGQSGDVSEPSYGNGDYWIVKTDSIGNKEWDKRYGGNTDEWFTSILQANDGGYLLGGNSRSGISGNKSQVNFGGGNDYWIVKIDSQGNIQWDKDFGGNIIDELASMKQTPDGGYILGGTSGSNISGNKSQNTWPLANGGPSYDYWIIKIDSLGNKQWDKDFGGTFEEQFCSLALTNDGGYILAGISASDIGGNKTQALKGLPFKYDYWIVKLDSFGNFQWDRDFGGTGDEVNIGSIVQTNDGGYLLSGTSKSPMGADKSANNLGTEQTWIIKTDGMGNKQWDKTIQTYSTSQYVISPTIQSTEGCYVVANFNDGGIGGDKTQTSIGGSDFWMIKFCNNPVSLSSSDTVFCDKQYIDFYDHSTNSPTSWQWLFPGGVPSSSTQQNPLGIYYNSFGSYDVTLIACNANGCDTLFLPNFINEFPGLAAPVVTWIADTLFSTPAYSYQWYLNSSPIPGANGQYYVFQQIGNYYVIVTDTNGCAASSFVVYTGINDVIHNLEINIIPNPSSGNFVIYDAPYNVTVRIYDVSGRVVHTSIINSTAFKVQTTVEDGVYFVEVHNGNRVIRKKIIVRN